VSEEVKEAFERGLREGAVHSLEDSAQRAHDRLDKHDVRINAMERVMYMGMGVVLLINIMPHLTEFLHR
jgi:hypothetical protein